MGKKNGVLLKDAETGKKQEARVGTVGPIGTEQVKNAAERLKKYKDGKSSLEKKIKENEEWWKMRHWQFVMGKVNENDPKDISAWLFNSIANKHADAMDNYPEPNVLPREESDKQDAEMLSDILPVIMERNDFEQTYNDAWWYKLKAGTCCYGVFWNKSLENGLGDIDIKQIDILNVFWEPGVKDIQKSKDFFNVELVEKKSLEAMYPELRENVGDTTIDIAKYNYDDNVDTSDKVAVVDWYYKTNAMMEDGSTINAVHFCKFVGSTVLYASENDSAYAQKGFYDHGRYPFEFDTLFTLEGTPCGFGYIDVMKSTQLTIDELSSGITKRSKMANRPRYFVKDGANINETEFSDWSKDLVHVSSGNLDDVLKEIMLQPADGNTLSVLQMKIDELKETSGNRDFSQGTTSGGVTAASAIAALQEAGSKLSRDMIKSAYRSYRDICYLVLENIRQFYDEPRFFRITGKNGDEQYVKYDNTNIRAQSMDAGFGVMSGRRPVFDIAISAQKSSPFTRIAQNELAKEMYQLGYFNPELADQALMALEMMDFEGKDEVVSKVKQNGTLLQMVQQMQMQMSQMGQIIAQSTGDTRIMDMMSQMGLMQTQNPAGGQTTNPNSQQGDIMQSATTGQDNSQAAKARKQAAAASTPRA